MQAQAAGVTVIPTDTAVILKYGNWREKTTPLAHITGVELNMPRLMAKGSFKVQTGTAPWSGLGWLQDRVYFNRKQAPAFIALKDEIVARLSKKGG